MKLLTRSISMLILALELSAARVVNSTSHAATVLPVTVGSGSFACDIPDNAPDGLKKMDSRQANLVSQDNRPIPTNKWWTNLLVSRDTGRLWVFPWEVETDRSGINATFPERWNDAGSDPQLDTPVKVGGQGYTPTSNKAISWGDWTLTFRQADDNGHSIDVTLGRGMPYVWFEFHGVTPTLTFPATPHFFNDNGAPVPMDSTADHLGIEAAGKHYGLFVPKGTSFTLTDNVITCHFPGAVQTAALCALPETSDLAVFSHYTDSIPRDSRMTWKYDPDSGTVKTTWSIQSEPFRGSEKQLIQGWLPHHYRDGSLGFPLNHLTYVTARGTMKCSVGDVFNIDFPFSGITPMLPVPQKTGSSADYSSVQMHQFVTDFTKNHKYGNDTYWGGKALVQTADYMLIAKQNGWPEYDILRDSLRAELANWFTYTPGKKVKYFARYPHWRALIGINPSYGSEAFNDNHFHYGYFVTASALLGMCDPSFLKDYGGMVRPIAKEYANYDRTDTDFPYFRTFDIWEGHSWAGGMSGATGNNQESSSEAVQSWGGLFLLGAALGDHEMLGAGAMGYSMETSAALEYWFNVHHDNFPPNFPHPIAGMVWGGGNLFGTYFIGDPAWVYGIQWVPTSPMQNYLSRDPASTTEMIHTMLGLQEKAKGTATISSLGGQLGCAVMSVAAQANPDWSAEQMNDLITSNDPIIHDDWAGITYNWIYANRMLGTVRTDYISTIPTSAAYYNATSKQITLVIYNPEASESTATVMHNGAKVLSVTVPAHSLISKSFLADEK